ncbi:unnamed protein product [marine sediment metagenome]|uniref:Uncharacterized protein n=1 Tax=marine sediment metagenome TaxID=412755 RepID=X0VNE2_9ZZZZ
MTTSRDRLVKIGAVAVDSGQLVIHDPCYETDITNEKVKEAMLATCPKDAPRDFNHTAKYAELCFMPGRTGAGVVFSSGFGDGCYDVWATIGPTDWGERVKKVEVILVDEGHTERVRPAFGEADPPTPYEEPKNCPECGGPLYLTYGGGFPGIGVDVCRDCGYHPATHTPEEPREGE